jgi:hypothetical protein
LGKHVIEKLFAIDPPPGFQNSGTTYQAKNRWHTGNLVRFFRGNKQPVGGWVQRTLTGAAIVGIPNAAVSWQLNDGTKYLAVGTTTNLYIVNASNVVYDITPATVLADGLTHRWQLEVFGSYLMAVSSRDSFVDDDRNNLYVWTGNTGAVATDCIDPVHVGPTSIYGMVVTPERFLVLLRGGDPRTATSRVIVGKPGIFG